MRSCLSSFVLLVMLLPGLAQAENAPRVEARIYYANPTELKSRLGDLLGRLDVFTVVGPEQGQPYLVIGTDEAQLAEIAARGLYTEVTWASLDDKFRAMTNCEPGSDAGRNFGYYFTYYEMRDTVRKLAQNFPAIARIDSSMKSWLNKPLYCLKISDNVGTAENEPQTFFNGATHAREPMSTHACIAFATLLLRDYGVDSATTWLVNHREIYILPVMNPDGYIYNSDSGGANAYWRKTRCNEGARTGPGVDMNRNFGYRWGLNDYGSSPTPSAETYRGPARWSETESAQLRDFLAAHRFRTQQDFHTYGRYNLLPWGHSLTWPPDSVTWVELGDSMFQNNGYETGPTQWVLYETNGGSTDYAFADTLLNGNPKFVSYGVSSELGIDDFWYGWDLPAYVDSEVGKNIPNCFYLTRVAGVLLRPLGMALDDSVSGNSSGQLDPGETAGVWFSLRNFAVHPLDTARSVTAVLTSPDTLVRVLDSLAGFPDILRRGTGANPTDQFQVQCSPNAAPGTLVNLRLVVGYTDDGMAASQSFIIPLMVGPVYDVGCPKIRVPRGIYDSGTVVTPGCTVVNYGIGSQNYAVRLKIGGTYNNTVAVTAHTPFTRRYITFPAYTAVHRGVQAVICSTELAGDMVPGNNRDTTWLAMQRNDVGCTRLIAPTGTIDSGTSVQPRCSTFNYGTTTPYYYYTRMKVGNFYTNQNYLLYHAPGARGYLTFTAASNWPRGTWTVSCSTQMAADLVPANDRRTGSVTVRVRDVGCRRIVIPAGNVDSGVAVTPSCTLYNYGTSTESYNVRLRIGTGYNTTVAISSHTAGTTRYVTFAGWTPPARGNYVLRCSTEFTGDVVRANDRKIDTARVQVHDLAARAIVAPVDTVLPGPLTPRALVRNYGSLREPARVIFAVDAGATYLDSVVLAAGLPFADTTLNFPAWHALAGSHIAQCSVRLGTEQLPANNAVSAGFNVWQVDFGVERIDAPVGRLDTADEVTPPRASCPMQTGCYRRP